MFFVKKYYTIFGGFIANAVILNNRGFCCKISAYFCVNRGVFIMSDNSVAVSKSDRKRIAAEKLKHRKKARLTVIIAVLIAALFLFLRFVTPVVFARLFGIDPLAGDKAFVTVDGYGISGREFAEFALQERDYFKNGYGDVKLGLGMEKFLNFRDAVMESVRYNYAFVKWAADEGISDSDLDPAAVEENIREIRDSYPSEEEYLAAMAESYMDEDLFEKKVRFNMVLSELEERIYSGKSVLGDVSEEDISDFYDDNGCVSALQIVIPFDSSDEDDQVEKYDTANEALKELASGTDFEMVMEKYNPDDSYAQGTVFVNDGNTPEEFIEKIDGMEVGDISGVFIAGSNYYILKRIEPTQEMKQDQLRGAVYNKRVMEYAQSITDAQKVVYSARFRMLDETNLKDPF